MTDRNKKIIYFGSIIFFSIIFLTFKFLKSASLIDNGKIESAYVFEIHHGTPKGGNIVIKYFFIFKGKRYYGGIDSGLRYAVKNKLLNTYFPVLIDSLNPKNNVLLVDSKRWKQMIRELPDSIKWIKEYY